MQHKDSGNRAVIYTRVSSNKQEEEGSSLDTQLAMCRAYAAERGYRLVGEFSDTWTGAQYRERPGLSKLRSQIRAGDVNVVICYALDRLSRDQVHMAVVVDEFEHHNARLELVTEEFENTPVGKFIRSAKSFAAEVERESITDRVVRGKKARVQSGRMIPSWKPLYGYQWDDPDEKNCYVIDPATAVHVRWIYEEYAGGASIRAIAIRLGERGIPSPAGRPHWTFASVRNVLTNPRYRGVAKAWNGTMDLPENAIPALIDDGVWAAVQHRLETNKQRSSRNAIEPEAALLRHGFVKCGECGWNMQVRRRSNGGFDYVCNRNSVSGQRTLGHPTILGLKLDTSVWSLIRRIMMTPEIIEGEIERLATEDATSTQLESLKAREAAVERESQSIVDAISRVNHPDSISALTTKLDRLGKQREELEIERAEIEGQHAQWQTWQESLRAFAVSRSEIAERMDGMPWELKRDLLDLLKLQVTVWPANRKPRYVVRTVLGEMDSVITPSQQSNQNMLTLYWSDEDIAAD